MAQGLHITGWVRNRRDGAVETLACGDVEALQSFQAWLHKGPAYALVSEVNCAPQPWENYSEFRIKP
jgi:acylphosphatase